MTTQQIIDYHNSLKEFGSTPMGAAFIRYERLRDDAWHQDARVEYLDHGNKAAKEAWLKSDEARKEFMKMLGYEEPK
jgi:hypothetical protein